MVIYILQLDWDINMSMSHGIVLRSLGVQNRRTVQSDDSGRYHRKGVGHALKTSQQRRSPRAYADGVHSLGSEMGVSD